MATTIEIRPDRTIVTTLNEQGKQTTKTLDVAVTPETSNRQLHQYNLPEANSLNLATGLKKLFPGLKLQGTRELDTLHPKDLISQHRPQPAQGDQVIIHSPGEELRILQALAEQNLLKTFSQLTLQAHDEALYENAEPASQISQWLQAQGFESAGVNTDDPDWPTYEFRRNPLQDALDAVAREKKKLQKQLKEQQEQVAALTEENRSLKQERDSEKQASAAQKQAEKALQERLDKAEAHQKAAENQAQELEARLKQMVAENQQTESSLKAVKSELAEARQQVSHEQEEAQKALEQLASFKSASQTDTKKLKNDLELAEQQLQDAEAKATKAQKQMVEAEQRTQASEQALSNAEKARAAEKEKHEAREQNLKVELDELREKGQELELVLEALAKEQNAHKQTVKALEEARAKAADTEQALNKALKEIEEERKAHQQTAKALADNKQWFQARKQQAERQLMELAELKKQNEQLQQKLSQEAETSSQRNKELASITEKLQEQQATNTKLDDLEKKIASLGSNLTNHLDKKLINTAKQIEDTLGLQNYLSTGELPLSYHGWPISPDLALYLTEKLETENYDLVIEFGSGTSTVLFAKVLMKKMLRQQATEQKRIGSAETNQEWQEVAELPNDNDLPKRVLTFEHNKYYHDQTNAMLRQANLHQVVDLVYAPLIDFNYQGENYLYYDCDKTLSKIAELYDEREPKILVLVDGPPGTTGVNARFPALLKLLHMLPKAMLDVVLDDYNRPDEKMVVDKWFEILEKRSRTFESFQLPLEKGAVRIRIG